MAKYLFSNDQRISELAERIKWVAKYVLSGRQLKDIPGKSDNNNAATLEFYYNLYENTENIKVAVKSPEDVIRNFVVKFQYPNTRTSDSFNDSINEGIYLAPFRMVTSILEALKSIREDSAYLTLDEILYFVFANNKVCKNPCVNRGMIADEILKGRELNKDYSSYIASNLSWNHYDRQVREMMVVITKCTDSFNLSRGILSYTPQEEDRAFLEKLGTYNYFWVPSTKNDFNLSNKEYISYMNMADTPYNLVSFDKEIEFSDLDGQQQRDFRPYITAIKSKPFLLLAGISGTGKSRIVRELARACWEEDSDEYKVQKPKNFEMVQVKPNWHDSSELIGYVSRVSGKAEFVAGDFLKFVAKAWEDQDTPYFLCLDEMNLAPVEQYFAEYLSVVESRKCGEDGVVTTDPILKKEDAEWYFNLTAAITSDDKVRTRFNEDGISIPQNLIVVGTVNMDETTFSFSRKVLDRAMTIEMNDVDLHGGLTKRHESIGKLGNAELVGSAVEGVDVYDDYTDVCNTALSYLQKVNDVLEGTPFKIAYRTRNEFLLYVVNNLPYNKDKDGNDLPQGYVIARALDEITSMKILSRIEGDDTKVKDSLLDALSQTITEGLNTLTDEDHLVKSVSVAKLEEMKNRLQSGYTSFWS